jgi:CheY-like chemotaxis protein
MKDPNPVLVVTNDDEKKSTVEEVLIEQKYRVVNAANSNEARLKFSNEAFHMAIIDMDTKGFKASVFVESIRRKEGAKNVKDNIPILVIGEKADKFSEEFSLIDNVKYLEAPFSALDLKKKLLTFTGHSDVISNNTRTIQKDEYLITEGGTSHEMFWILSGKFVITKMNQDDKNVIIGEVYPGELVGEMSFLDNLTRSASVRAVDEAEVLVIPHKKFIDVLDHQPRWFRSLMQTMSQRLRGANTKITRKVVGEDTASEKGKEDTTDILDKKPEV